MSKISELRDRKGALLTELMSFRKKLDDDKYEWTPADEETWSAVNKDYSSVQMRLEKQEQLETYSVPKDIEPVPDMLDKLKYRHSEEAHEARETSAKDFNLAFRAWSSMGRREPKRDEARAAKRAGIDLNSKSIEIPLHSDYTEVRRALRNIEFRDLNAADEEEIVPKGFQREWEAALLFHGPVRNIARVIRTATGGPLSWPNYDDTSTSATIVAEATTDATPVDPTVSEVNFITSKFKADVRISSELLEDSAFNVASEVGRMLGERQARGQNGYFTTGTGTNEPHGYMIAGTAFTQLTAGLVVTADDLFDLFGAVDPAYRNNNSWWVAHDEMWQLIRQIKDTTNQYLWQPGLTLGQPDKLLGFPTAINQNMQSGSPWAAGEDPIAFGDFSRFVIREGGTLRLVRTSELYIEEDEILFVSFQRVDSRLISSAAPIKFLNISA